MKKYSTILSAHGRGQLSKQKGKYITKRKSNRLD